MRHLANLDTSAPYSVLGLGVWQFGSWEWGSGEDDAGVALVRRARELGVTVFDAAEMYGFGRSERILGEALADTDRDQVVIATKFFPVLPVGQQRAEASARRLGVQRIDLYQLPQPNPLLRDTVTMGGIGALQDSGLIDEVGLSHYTLVRWRIAETALGRRVLSNQVPFSLLSREPAEQMVPFAAQTGRVMIALNPVEHGVLSGHYDVNHPPSIGIQALNPAFLPENLERLSPLIGVLREVANAHDATPAQIALAWVVRHPHVVAIPEISSLDQLESSVAAADLVLRDDEFTALTAAAQQYEPVRGMGVARSLAETLLRMRS